MKSIIAPVRRIFSRIFSPGPSTDHALAVFSQAQSELQAVIALEDAEIDSIRDEIEWLEVARLDAFERRKRAQKVADRLDALVSA